MNCLLGLGIPWLFAIICAVLDVKCGITYPPLHWGLGAIAGLFACHFISQGPQMPQERR